MDSVSRREEVAGLVMRESSRLRIEQAEIRAQAIRDAALSQGLERFPLDGKGSKAMDRYSLPDRLLVDELRALTNMRLPNYSGE